jgi:hypothetical protein
MWQAKSKTIHAGIVTIVWGILMLFGITDPGPAPVTWEDPDPKPNKMSTVIGLGALASGAVTLKGRADAEKRIKGEPQ